MASSAKHISLILLLTLLSSLQIHARDSQFFNKVPSKTNTNVVKEQEFPSKEEALGTQEKEPSFVPENENAYGLYGHESGQLPPATTTTTPATNPTATTNGEPFKTTTNLPYKTESKEPFYKYLPKNYNPVAYVTVPEDTTTTDSSFLGNEFTTNPTTTTNGEPYKTNTGFPYKTESKEPYRYLPNNNNNYQEELGTSFMENGKENYYYNNGENFYNGQKEGMSDTRFTGSGYTTTPTYNYYNSGNYNKFQKQGMSDTRFLENGKYYYDIQNEKYARNPYENSRVVSRNGFYGNNENSYEYNNLGNQNEEEFQNEEEMP